MRSHITQIFTPNSALLHHLPGSRLLKGFADLDESGQYGMDTVTMAGMLRQQDRIIATDGRNNAGRFAGSNVHGSGCTASPIRFCCMHRVAAVAAKIYAIDKIRQAGSLASQLEESRILISTWRNDPMSYGDDPGAPSQTGSLPFANMQRMLADKIEINRFAMW